MTAAHRITRGGLRFFVALVLLATAVGKGLDLSGFTDVIADYRVLPDWMLWPAALAMTTSELLLSAWLFSGRSLQRAALAAAALHAVFIGWISVALLRGLSIENCGCFGVFFSRPLSGWTVVEDAVMLAACAGLYALCSASKNARPQSVSSNGGSSGTDTSMPARSANLDR